MSVMDLERLYNLKFVGTEEVLKYCMSVNLVPTKQTCWECGRDMRLQNRKDSCDGKVWVCKRSDMGQMHTTRISIRRGSWFENSCLKMIDILLLTFMWCSRFTAEMIVTHAKVSSGTVSAWMSSCREVCVEICLHRSQPIGGENCLIELDEAMFSNRLYSNGRRFNAIWVFGGVDRANKKCFFVPVSEPTKETLLKVLTDYVLPGSTVVSDVFKAYKCMKDKDYTKLSAQNSLTFKYYDAHSQNVEGICYFSKKNYIKSEVDKYYAEYLARRIIDKTVFFDEFIEELARICEIERTLAGTSEE